MSKGKVGKNGTNNMQGEMLSKKSIIFLHKYLDSEESLEEM